MEKDFCYQDARKLMSLVCHEEQLLEKKRRWLMGSSTTSTSTSEISQKRSKRPKFLTNASLPESFIRSDEVSVDIVRANVERSFGSSTDNQDQGYHVVQDYLKFFDLHKMEGFSVNPSNFLKTFSSIINDLNNTALLRVASIITKDKISFVKTRPKMKKIIKDYLPEFLAGSNSMDWSAQLQQVSEVFKNPSNFWEKRLTLATSITPPLLSAIHQTLEELDKMPYQDLLAVNKKLKGGGTFAPLFPPKFTFVKRGVLLERIQKRFKKIFFELKEGIDMPKPLAKALSVVRLSLKQTTRCVDIRTSEFFPFSTETISLQNDILKALWSLPKVKYDELKALQPLVDPEAKVPKNGLRNVLNKYLTDCLFWCDEICIPQEVLSVIALINRRSRRRPSMFSKETREEDIEVVLNVSSQLRQTVGNFLSVDTVDEVSSVESGDDNDENDFDLSSNDYCFNLGKHGDEQIFGRRMNEEAEGTDDSGTVFAPHQRGMITKEPKLEQDAEEKALGPCFQESVQLQPKIALLESRSMRETTIKEICDDTSLVSYRLVGCMLDKLLQIEGRDVDAMTRHYLSGGSSHPVDSQGIEDEDTSLRVLFQATEDLLPALPKSCIERVKKLVGLQ